MCILALSTSTPRGSVAVLRSAEDPALVTYVDLQGHAERLFEAIDRAMTEAGAARSDLRGVACDIGPGSFTGVRVGVASAKGIAVGLGLPLAGATSLEAMARAAFATGVAAEGARVIAAIDAKKGELFVAAYDSSGATRMAPRSCRADAARVDELVAEQGGDAPVVLVGEILATLLPERAIPRSAALDLPDASWVGRVAAARLATPHEVEPLYVRPPDITLPSRVRTTAS